MVIMLFIYFIIIIYFDETIFKKFKDFYVSNKTPHLDKGSFVTRNIRYYFLLFPLSGFIIFFLQNLTILTYKYCSVLIKLHGGNVC